MLARSGNGACAWHIQSELWSQQSNKRARQPYMHLSLAQSLSLSSLLLNIYSTISAYEARISRSLSKRLLTLHNHIIELLNRYRHKLRPGPERGLHSSPHLRPGMLDSCSEPSRTSRIARTLHTSVPGFGFTPSIISELLPKQQPPATCSSPYCLI